MFEEAGVLSAAQLSEPHLHARRSWPATIAPTASERRSPIERGSSSQTPATIAATRRLSTAASVANSLPHTDVICGWVIEISDREVPRAHGCFGPSQRRRIESLNPGIDLVDPASAPTAGPKPLALSASAASISAIASRSSTNCVRQVMAETTREFTRPCMYNAAIRGSRSRSATAIRIWPDARRCPTVIAAPLQQQPNPIHRMPNWPDRRRHRRGGEPAQRSRPGGAPPQQASARAQSSIAATTVASSAATNSESNIHSIMPVRTDA